MGLTERHWFEGEEAELTERQLENAVEEVKAAYERGYQKGYLDGAKAQEAVKPEIGKNGCGSCWYICPECRLPIAYKDMFCRHCGRRLKWDD